MQCVARIAKANEIIEDPLEEAVFAACVRDEAPGKTLADLMLVRLLDLNLARREGV